MLTQYRVRQHRARAAEKELRGADGRSGRPQPDLAHGSIDVIEKGRALVLEVLRIHPGDLLSGCDVAPNFFCMVTSGSQVFGLEALHADNAEN